MRDELRRRPLFYAALALSALIALLPEREHPLPAPSGTPLLLGGTIVSEVESRQDGPAEPKSYFLFEVRKVWRGTGGPQDVRMRVRTHWRNAPADLLYGDVAVIEGELASIPGKRNPGGFDARAFWRHRGVGAAFFVKKKADFKVLQRGQGSFLQSASIAARRSLSQRLSRDFDPKQSAFLKALFLGEKSDLEQDFKDLFLRTGTLHILAVSGFNIAFLSGVMWLLLRPVPVPRNWKLAMILAGVWAYCLLVGWQAPVMRAALMATVFLIGGMIGRKGDGLNALGLAACVILVLRPGELREPGFQLSFLAVFGLVTLAPLFLKREAPLPHETYTWKERLSFSVRELFWVSFICYFLTLPLVVRSFYIVTPYALLANLAVVPLSFLLFLFAIPYFFLPFLSAAMKLVMLVFVKCLFFIENLPGSVWTVGETPVWLAAALAAGTLFLFFTKRFSRDRLRASAIVLFCANIFLVQEALHLVTRRFEMSVLDVGQGDSIYFEFPDGGNLLIDGGTGRYSDKGRWVIGPFLRSKGVRSLDALVITHAHEDHIGGLATVLDEFHVKNVFVSFSEHPSASWKDLQKRIRRENARVTQVRRAGRIEGYPDTSVEVLHPERPTDNPNEDSVVLRITHGGHSFLLAGDVQNAGMRSLLESGVDLRADVLKVPHHGGKADKEADRFLAAVAPRYSLISCGARNPFKHPSPSTLASLGSVPGNQVLRTDLSGALRVFLEGDALSIVVKS